METKIHKYATNRQKSCRAFTVRLIYRGMNSHSSLSLSLSLSLSVCVCEREIETKWVKNNARCMSTVFMWIHTSAGIDTSCSDRFRRATEDKVYYACLCSTWTSHAENIHSEADCVPFRSFEFLILSVFLISSMSRSLLSHSFTFIY